MSEAWRILRLKGARIVLFSSASRGLCDWFMKAGLRVHALENGYYVIWANRDCGMLIDPEGKVIRQAKNVGDIITAKFDLDKTIGKGFVFARDFKALEPLLDKSLQRAIKKEFKSINLESVRKAHVKTIKKKNYVASVLKQVKQ